MAVAVALLGHTETLVAEHGANLDDERFCDEHGRKNGVNKQYIHTLQFPSNYPVSQCQALYGRGAPRTHIRVLARVFWDLLHDHVLTDRKVVEPTQYIKRAADIYMLVVKTSRAPPPCAGPNPPTSSTLPAI